MSRAIRYMKWTDVSILFLCVVLLASVLGAVGPGGRERARRAVCLANLGQLTQAWLNYAVDHNGKIVNGDAGYYRSSGDLNEDPWVGRCWASDFMAGGQLPEDLQADEIRKGAMWSNTQDLRLYRCPSGHAGQMLSYGAVSAMNGRHPTGTFIRGGSYVNDTGVRIDHTVLWLKNLDEIIDPDPAERVVFIDQGFAIPGSFAVHYTQEQWWDGPPGRHGDGTNVSFADGHVEHWQWQGEETIEAARQQGPSLAGNFLRPMTQQGREDLHRFQRAVWGRLGYGQPEEPDQGGNDNPNRRR